MAPEPTATEGRSGQNAAQSEPAPARDGRDGRGERQRDRRPRGERSAERRDRAERADGNLPASDDAASRDREESAPTASPVAAASPAEQGQIESLQPAASGQANDDAGHAATQDTPTRERRGRERNGRERGARGDRGARADQGEHDDERSPRRTAMGEQPQQAHAGADDAAAAQQEASRASGAGDAAPVRSRDGGSGAPALATLPKVEAFVLPMEELAQVVQACGLDWVNSDAEKIRVVQAAIAAQPQPIHIPREPAPRVVIDEGPLVLVETRRDLRTLTLPFEQSLSN